MYVHVLYFIYYIYIYMYTHTYIQTYSSMVEREIQKNREGLYLYLIHSGLNFMCVGKCFRK